ncbi:restriction endonuclease subunit S [Dyella japonica]|uniref:Type I restriction modification DNA specificity domain-containing protein n=1 Tax=Dyella japonica DSM 16301 TaxID=1440762 RepID=A0A0G9GXW1_9GAMM|nr:restriction endonuclease subunit S [Dyella japonica]KLD62076.1 hypothetical protein Y882_17880 [Dyella japonica DSM 16301]
MRQSKVAQNIAAPAANVPVQKETVFGAAFDLLVQSQQGIAKLRELILSLAFRGRLLPQEPGDESALVLLSRVRAEKESLIDAGVISREKSLEPIADEEIAYSLPAGWIWVRLPQIYFPLSLGKKTLLSSAIKDKGSIPVVDQGQRHVAGYTDEVELMLNIPGPVVIFGDHTTQVKYIDFDFAPGAEGVKVLRPVLQNEKYFFWQLKAFRLESRGYARHFKALNSKLFALAPLAEQARIVDRIEELMRICDALEARGQLQDEQHERLVATLFDTLASSESAEALSENWRRIATHFDLLFDRPESIDVLERVILQLAVRGLLVAQDATDAPARDLLQEIQSRRGKFGTAVSNHDQATRREDLPFKLPNGWEAVSLLDVCAVGGGATPSKGNPRFWDGSIPWVSPKDMKVDVINDSQDHVSSKAINETRLPLISANSLLVVVRGMILAHSFPVAVAAREVTINQDMKSFTPYLVELLEFLSLALKGFKPEILSLVARSTHGTCKLESGRLFSFMFGLPPLAEQRRIVARVDELRRLCVALRERLSESRGMQSRLADGLIGAVS